MLDLTGALTQKYQARFALAKSDHELISALDTAHLLPCIAETSLLHFDGSSVNHATPETLLPIAALFERLRMLVGKQFPDLGSDQDDGRCPDVRHQLLEVKLQTSSTIDLGLVCPSSVAPLDEPQILGKQVQLKWH